MRALLRAGVLVVAAAGFCVALSHAASADVVAPKSAIQPPSIRLLEEETVKAMAAATAYGGAEAVAETKAGATDEVVATPAPEQVVRPAPAHMTRTDTVVRPEPSVVDRVIFPLRMGFQQLGASLGRVVGACEVGLNATAGGPALVFAVLGMVAPFIRRRVLGARRTADEDVPEFLFARELTPPG